MSDAVLPSTAYGNAPSAQRPRALWPTLLSGGLVGGVLDILRQHLLVVEGRRPGPYPPVGLPPALFAWRSARV